MRNTLNLLLATSAYIGLGSVAATNSLRRLQTRTVEECSCQCHGTTIGMMPWDLETPGQEDRDGEYVVTKALRGKTLFIKVDGSDDELKLKTTTLMDSSMCGLDHYVITGDVFGTSLSFTLRCDDLSNKCMVYEGVPTCNRCTAPPPPAPQAPSLPGVCSDGPVNVLTEIEFKDKCSVEQWCGYPATDGSGMGSTDCGYNLCCPDGKACYNRECTVEHPRICGMADTLGNLVKVEPNERLGISGGNGCAYDKSCFVDDDCPQGMKCFDECSAMA